MYRKILPLTVLCLPPVSLADHLSGGFGLQSAAPFWTEGPQTLKAGKFNVGFRGDYQKLRAMSDQELIALRIADAVANPELYAAHHEGEEEHGGDEHARQADLHNVDELFGGAFRLAYGITDNLTVGFRLPFVYRSSISEVSEAHDHGHGDGFVAHDIYDHGSSEGIGDMSFWGQYQFYRNAKSSAAVILGFKAPTGETNNQGFDRRYNANTGLEKFPANDSEHSNRLETHLQPGSGSWDSSYGLAYGYDMDVVRFNTSLMYTVTTKGSQNTDLGDLFNYNFAISMPVHNMVPCSGCSWNFILEANGEWRDREKRGDLYIHNSGGHSLYVSPGVRFISNSNWNLGASFGYAVIHDTKGYQSDPDFRIGTSFNVNL
ncbi:MAG: hypothetical protein ACU836_11690 [Gammaproteobacteria bacterium]